MSCPNHGGLNTNEAGLCLLHIPFIVKSCACLNMQAMSHMAVLSHGQQEGDHKGV